VTNYLWISGVRDKGPYKEDLMSEEKIPPRQRIEIVGPDYKSDALHIELSEQMKTG
jgi:hypothetical protein